MKRFLMTISLCAALAGLGALSPAAGRAATIYTSISLNMWSGPSPAYPRVTRLPAGVVVQVFGCLDDWYWCDVGWRGMRGWVPGEYLYGRYGGSSYYISQYGPQFGFNIVLFSPGVYWDRYYRERPWYRERDRWVRQPPPVYRPAQRRQPIYGQGGWDRSVERRPAYLRPAEPDRPRAGNQGRGNEGRGNEGRGNQDRGGGHGRN